MVYLQIIAGLIFLLVGAESLVRGASRLARSLGIPPLIIGLTVVAYGTSTPELAVSIKGSLEGYGDIALGNVLGSNIFNVLFILGFSALIVPLTVSKQLIRFDIPIMIGVSLLSWLFSFGGQLNRIEGLILTVSLIGYTIFLIRWGLTKEKPGDNLQVGDERKKRHWHPYMIPLAFIVCGLVFLIIGSQWLVKGAVDLARLMGVSELLIGLTLVAAGTSFPEVATSIVAAIRGERDIAIGNVVGSNIFNILGVLGIATALSGKMPVSKNALYFDFPVMIAVSLICLPICFSGKKITRWEGALFLGFYFIYLSYLILRDNQIIGIPFSK